MMRFAVVEISGRQFKIEPGKNFQVDYLGDIQEYLCEKVLLVADEKEVKVGKPYLKDSLKFKVEEVKRGKKIRVATYHAKANTRRVKGSRASYSVLSFSQGKSVEKT